MHPERFFKKMYKKVRNKHCRYAQLTAEKQDSDHHARKGLYGSEMADAMKITIV